METAKIIFFNLLSLLAIVGLLVLVPLLTLEIHSLYRGSTWSANTDSRGSLPNYNGKKWARTHFHEWRSLDSHYQDYVVWRRSEFSGDTINVDATGLRRTILSKELRPGPTLEFYGGSTMWGTGSRDAETIPSLASQNFGLKTVNLGESGYTARQSLALLSNRYLQSDDTRRQIIFYDGANDVAIGCRTELSGASTPRESQIRQVMSSLKGLEFLLLPALTLIDMATRKSGNENPNVYDCASNPAKAMAVARNLVQSWKMAAALSKENGDRFLAILQPVAFSQGARTDHLNLSKILGDQFGAVYPLIRQQIKNQSFETLDLSTAYDGNEYIFIDFCHVSPNGHPRIVAAIKSKLGLENQ